jgi:hypothetical protein
LVDPRSIRRLDLSLTDNMCFLSVIMGMTPRNYIRVFVASTFEYDPLKISSTFTPRILGWLRIGP